MLDEVFPNLTVVKPEVVIPQDAQMTTTESVLMIEGDTVASWSDKYTAECKVEVLYNGKEVKSGDRLSEPGVLTLTVTNDQGKSSSAEITLIDEVFPSLTVVRQELNVFD